MSQAVEKQMCQHVLSQLSCQRFRMMNVIIEYRAIHARLTNPERKATAEAMLFKMRSIIALNERAQTFAANGDMDSMMPLLDTISDEMVAFEGLQLLLQRQ